MAKSRGGKKTPHILSLQGNDVTKGNDMVTGDVHGTVSVLRRIMEQLTRAGDRLFIAGDLVDRGEEDRDNVEVVRAIIENNKQEENPKIYCVRGNHEDMCRDSIRGLTDLAGLTGNLNNEGFLIAVYIMYMQSAHDDELKTFMRHPLMSAWLSKVIDRGRAIFRECIDEDTWVSDEEHIEEFLQEHQMKNVYNELKDTVLSAFEDVALHEYEGNGGAWMIRLFEEELHGKNRKITVTDNGEVVFAEDSEVKMVRDYLDSLPYIIHVDGEIPFVVVHADLPIDLGVLITDEVLNLDLDDKQIQYLLWARTNDRDVPIKIIEGRGKYSILVYCGHSINGGVRPDSNSINLDVGAFDIKMGLLVNHSTLECTVINFQNDASPDVIRRLENILELTQTQLKLQPLFAKAKGSLNEGKRESPDAILAKLAREEDANGPGLASRLFKKKHPKKSAVVDRSSSEDSKKKLL